MRSLISFLCGVMFAVGLSLSGMTQPHIVLDFFDVTQWNPTLMFVMVGALSVHSLSYFLMKTMKTPLLENRWHIPRGGGSTAKLIIGSVLFGIGWGLAGLCPGTAWTSLSTGSSDMIAFVLFMLGGMKVANLISARRLRA